MLSINDFLTQIFQPYFFYSIVFLTIGFVCVKIFLNFNRSTGRTSQSILWLTPLLVPPSVLILFHPQTLISVASYQLPPMPPTFPYPAIVLFRVPPTVSVISITGLLCLSGAVAASCYLIITLGLGNKIAMKAFHVIMMSPEEYPAVQEKVAEMAKIIGVSPPKVGLTDDLRPNAFMLGYGRNTRIVFSLGILKMLETAELTAVIAHELAHIKSKDYLLRNIAYSLSVLSFFNPLSYFATCSFQKERELLADEKAASSLNQPKLMANVLTKIEGVLQGFPKEPLTSRLSASLFLVSPLTYRTKLLSAHPPIAIRLGNINSVISKSPMKPHKLHHKASTLLLVAILACVVVVSGFYTIQAQSSYFQGYHEIILKNPTDSTIIATSMNIIPFPTYAPLVYLQVAPPYESSQPSHNAIIQIGSRTLPVPRWSMFMMNQSFNAHQFSQKFPETIYEPMFPFGFMSNQNPKQGFSPCFNA